MTAFARFLGEKAERHIELRRSLGHDICATRVRYGYRRVHVMLTGAGAST
ncbi:hypothetical protein X735_32705 [Mesorhizobium sp. L2C085B000]|nr:hypothetical protein X735_32705 [Mesorhizobium sp. L2C085B000]